MECCVTPRTRQILASLGPTSTVTTLCWGPTATAESTLLGAPACISPLPVLDCSHLMPNGTRANNRTKPATHTKDWVIAVINPC